MYLWRQFKHYFRGCTVYERITRWAFRCKMCWLEKRSNLECLREERKLTNRAQRSERQALRISVVNLSCRFKHLRLNERRAFTRRKQSKKKICSRSKNSRHEFVCAFQQCTNKLEVNFWIFLHRNLPMCYTNFIPATWILVFPPVSQNFNVPAPNSKNGNMEWVG